MGYLPTSRSSLSTGNKDSMYLGSLLVLICLAQGLGHFAGSLLVLSLACLRRDDCNPVSAFNVAVAASFFSPKNPKP